MSNNIGTFLDDSNDYIIQGNLFMHTYFLREQHVFVMNVVIVILHLGLPRTLSFIAIGVCKHCRDIYQQTSFYLGEFHNMVAQGDLGKSTHRYCCCNCQTLDLLCVVVCCVVLQKLHLPSELLNTLLTLCVVQCVLQKLHLSPLPISRLALCCVVCVVEAPSPFPISILTLCCVVLCF